jgi:hypothetical protein
VIRLKKRLSGCCGSTIHPAYSNLASSILLA